MSILDCILKVKKEEVAQCKKRVAARDLLVAPLAKRQCLSMRKALQDSSVGIIAEFKRKSPSRGYIHQDAIVEEVVKGYALAGAAVCSVLTDGHFFGGSLLDLALARREVNIPLLRKDFIIDEYQIAEAKAYGADAILLIAAALSPEQSRHFTDIAHAYGMEVLLEVHQKEELDRILPQVDMVGINNRNLATFQTDIHTSFELGPQIPDCHLKVSESGIHTKTTVNALRKAGFRGFLMGEYFMKEERPDQVLKNFIQDVD